MTIARIATLAASAAALVLGTSAPLAVHAQDYDTKGYDGYCYTHKNNAETNGAVVGAIAGGALGGTVSNTKHKGVGTVAGAVIGGVIGSQVGKSSVKCYNGDYYSYAGHYYTPPSAPDGYEVLYFHSRPEQGYYYDNVRATPPSWQGGGGYAQGSYSQDDRYANNQDHAYQGQGNQGQGNQDQGYGDDRRPHPHYAVAGWRDSIGVWHNGRPRAVGWQDDNGQWHVGEVVAYGWRDAHGDWHEDRADGQGSSDR